RLLLRETLAQNFAVPAFVLEPGRKLAIEGDGRREIAAQAQQIAERAGAPQNRRRAAGPLPAIERRRALLPQRAARGERFAEPLGLGLLGAQLRRQRLEPGAGGGQLLAAHFQIALDFAQGL